MRRLQVLFPVSPAITDHCNNIKHRDSKVPNGNPSEDDDDSFDTGDVQSCLVVVPVQTIRAVAQQNEVSFSMNWRGVNGFCSCHVEFLVNVCTDTIPIKRFT